MRRDIPVIRVRNDYGDVDVRDGVILCFFMRHSHAEIADAVWRVLHTYIQAIPPGALGWYVNFDGDLLEFDDKGWAHIRKIMFGYPASGAWHVSLADDPGCIVAGYGFDYSGQRVGIPHFETHEGITSAVYVSFPTEYLLEHGAGHLRGLALELGRELPFSYGYASLALLSHPGIWFGVRRQLVEWLERYPGLDLYQMSETASIIGTGARGAYWLTFLGPTLLDDFGGVVGLRERLGSVEVHFEALEGNRALLTLGEWPEAMDREKGPPPAQYRELARLLEPYFREEGSILPPMTWEYMHRWLRRLCG